MAHINLIGWVATGIFACSYFATRPSRLRLIQAGAAAMWVAYGALIHATPVVVANVIVAGAAVCSSFARAKRRPTRDAAMERSLVASESER